MRIEKLVLKTDLTFTHTFVTLKNTCEWIEFLRKTSAFFIKYPDELFFIKIRIKSQS